MKTWLKLQSALDLKGGVWVGMFTFILLIGTIHTLFFGGKDIPGGVLGLYGTILGAFAVTKTTAKVMNGTNGHKVDEQ